MIDESFRGTRVGAERFDANEKTYTGVFLDDESQKKLHAWWKENVGAPLHERRPSHPHMTIKFAPSASDVAPLALGSKATLKVTGYAHDEHGQVVRVSTEHATDSTIPHVTMATSKDARSVYSHALLAKGVKDADGPTLTGTIGHKTTHEDGRGRNVSGQSRDELGRWDYSEDQPRDDHGRFAGGGTGTENDTKGGDKPGGGDAAKTEGTRTSYASDPRLKPLHGHATLIDERESYITRERAKVLDARIEDLKSFIETSRELLTQYEKDGKANMVAIERRELERDTQHLAEAKAAREDLSKPLKDNDLDRAIRDAATHEVFKVRGLGTLHEEIGQGWIGSSSSAGAMILHADLLNRGVPGSFANDKERMTVGRVLASMNIKNEFHDRFTKIGDEAKAKLEASEKKMAAATDHLMATIAKHNIPLEGDPIPREQMHPEVRDASDAAVAAQTEHSNLRRETEEAISNAEYARKSFATYSGGKMQIGRSGGIAYPDQFAKDVGVYREVQQRLVREGLDRDFPGQTEFTVYRGIYGDNAKQALKANGEAIHVDSRPATSWSLNTRTAVAFARGLGAQGNIDPNVGAVLSMKVPREAVIDYFGLHKNSMAEDEFVIAGAHAMPVMVSHPDSIRTDAKERAGKKISINAIDQEDWLRMMRKPAEKTDAFYLVADRMTRFDYSEDQARDDHGRFAGGGLHTESDGKGGDKPGGADAVKETPISFVHVHEPKDLAALSTQLEAMHGGFGAEYSAGKLLRDDIGSDTYDHELFSKPERMAVLAHVRNIVTEHTGIPQKYQPEELRIVPLNGANGMFSPPRELTFASGTSGERLPSRITIDPRQHEHAIAALKALGNNEKPTHEQLSGLHTYVHEMCHTTSPMALGNAEDASGKPIESGYAAHGAVIEEVTTEVMARGVMSRLIAETPERGAISSPHAMIQENRGGARSSYQPAINWTLEKIRDAVSGATAAPNQKALGVEGQQRGRASLILRDATQAYRALQPKSPFTRNQAAAAFAKCVGEAAAKIHHDAKLYPGEVAEAFRLQVMQIDGGPDADILRRFDAATMTRFDAAQSVWTVPRNDVDAAMAISNPSPDEMGVLLMLQDNPETLLQALANRSQ